MHQPDEKQQQNQFVSELLSLCLSEAHADGVIFEVAMSTESLLSGDLVVADGADTLSLVQVTDTHLTGTETGCL